LECSPVAKATFEFEIGGYPAVAYLNDAGFDEVVFQTTVCPTTDGRRMIGAWGGGNWQWRGGATTYFWLERKSGRYLTTNHDYGGTKTITATLAALPNVKPHGFGLKPPKGGYSFERECEGIFGRYHPNRTRKPLDDEIDATINRAPEGAGDAITVGVHENQHASPELARDGQFKEGKKAIEFALTGVSALRCAGIHPNWKRDDDEFSAANVETAIAFLKRCRKTTKPSRGSYGLKHAAEQWGQANGMQGYIANGELIVAAVYLGFTMKWDWRGDDNNSPNVMIGVVTPTTD
jgi:hypothetical protein